MHVVIRMLSTQHTPPHTTSHLAPSQGKKAMAGCILVDTDQIKVLIVVLCFVALNIFAVLYCSAL